MAEAAALAAQVQAALAHQAQLHHNDLAAVQAQVQQQLQELQQQIQQQQYAIADAAAAAAAAPRRPVPRIANAAPYTGATPPLDEWLAVVVNHFAFYALVSDAQRIHYASALLQGPALDWYLRPGAEGAPTTWALFEEGLRARFQPVTTADAAREKLKYLVQGKHSVTSYVATFRRHIASLLGTMDAGSQLYAFRSGLNRDLQIQLRQHAPTTLEAAINFAVRTGAPIGGAEGAMDLSAMDDSASSSSSSATAPHLAGLGVTQDELTAILASLNSAGFNRNSRGNTGTGGGSNLPKITGLTPDRVRQLMEAGKCFYCSEIGHMSRACPKKAAAKAASVVASKN